jgi:hypothetical protein
MHEWWHTERQPMRGRADSFGDRETSDTDSSRLQGLQFQSNDRKQMNK